VIRKRIAGALAALRLASTGQTMTEYAMIVAAVAIVVLVSYETLGQSLTSFINSFDSQI